MSASTQVEQGQKSYAKFLKKPSQTTTAAPDHLAGEENSAIA